MIKRTIFLLTGLAIGSNYSRANNIRTVDEETPSKKNVIWVVSDQHRAQAIEYMGDTNLKTPNLNRLASEGVTFMNAYSGCPWSSPFRGSLLTGRYPHNTVYRTPQHLDVSLPLISDVFNDEGYITAYFGKWHLFGHNYRAFVPKEERGRFDVWVAYENNNSQYDSWVHGHDLWGRNDSIADSEKLKGYETDVLIDKAISFINRISKDTPFFLVISVQPPHDPYVAPQTYMEKRDKEKIVLRKNVPPIKRIENKTKEDLLGYYAQIENLDYNIGRLYKALKEKNILDDTNIIYFSDHGDCHGSHGYIRKSSPWQESIRIPCIFRPAGVDVKNHISQAMFNHVDISATTLGLCGIKVPLWMYGTDYSNHVLGKKCNEKEEPDAVLLQHIYPKNFECLDRPWRGIVTKDGWKYVVIKDQPIMLFNLKEDPYELNNMVYLASPEVKIKKKELSIKLQSMLNNVGDSFIVTE